MGQARKNPRPTQDHQFGTWFDVVGNAYQFGAWFGVVGNAYQIGAWIASWGTLRPPADHGYGGHDQVQVVVDPHAGDSVQRDVLSGDGGDRDAVHADVGGLAADVDPDSVESLAGCILHGDRWVRGPVRYGAGVRAVADLHHVLAVAPHYEIRVPGGRRAESGRTDEDAECFGV